MTFVYVVGGAVAVLVLLCLVAVLCMPRYLEDMDAERL